MTVRKRGFIKASLSAWMNAVKAKGGILQSRHMHRWLQSGSESITLACARRLTVIEPLMRHSFLLLLAFAASLTAGEPTDKNPAALATPIDAWSRPLVGGGVKTSEDYTDGNFFLTAPLWSTLATDGTLGGSYLMLEPYTSWGEQGEVVASLGLSFRHLFNDQPLSKLSEPALAGWRDEGLYLGGNVFLDMLDTQFDNRFWQLGVGLEAGSRYFEVRGNYYLPLTDRKLAKRYTESQTFKQTVTQTFGSPQVSAYGDPFAVGNSVYQDVTVSAGTSARQVTTTTTVKRITDIFEEGMQGWDLEAALLIPWVDQWMDVKLLGGYFAFANAPLGPQTGLTGEVEGFKAGIEVRPVPAVALSAMWYEDERFIGSDWMLGVRFEIPLDKTWKDAFKPRRRHLIERLAEPVHRQNAAIKVGNKVEQKREVKQKRAVKAVAVRQVPGRIIIRDRVIFVDADAEAANPNPADGTAENPYGTIQEGVDFATAQNPTLDSSAPLWTVYVQAIDDDFYEEDVEIGTSVRLIGSGVGGGFQALGGKTFGGVGEQPNLEGGIIAEFLAEAVEINFLEVRGFHIDLGDSNNEVGIDILDVPESEILNNNIHFTYIGIRNINERHPDAYTLIQSNEGFDTGLGVFIGVQKNGSKTVADVYNNFIEFAQEGFNFESRSGGSLDVDFYHNETSEVLTGVSFSHSGIGSHDARIDDNLLNTDIDDGLGIFFGNSVGSLMRVSGSQDNAVFGGVKGFNYLGKAEPSSGGFYLNGDLISFPSVGPMP